MKTTTKFKQVCFSAAVFVATSTSASAQDWSGAYAGIGFSQHSGENTDKENGVVDTQFLPNPFKRNGSMTSYFAGYRLQNGNFAYGPELSLNNGSLAKEQVPVNKLTNYQTIKFNTGYVVGDLLFSAGLGYFIGTIERPGGQDGFQKPSGILYSVGVDYLLSDKIAVGAVLTQRQFEDTKYPTFPAWTLDGNDTAFELRVGYNF